MIMNSDIAFTLSSVAHWKQRHGPEVKNLRSKRKIIKNKHLEIPQQNALNFNFVKIFVVFYKSYPN